MVPQSIVNLTSNIAKLPGIGQKTAQRLAFYLLRVSKIERSELAESILQAENYTSCPCCFTLMEPNEACPFCDNPKRDSSIICVVEDFLDLLAIEQAGGYQGLYHILGGVLSPIDGVTMKDLHADELFKRLENIKEIIIATNASLEGEATAVYLKQKAHETHPEIHITRIARGIPMGSDLEFADSMTLQSAFEGRRAL